MCVRSVMSDSATLWTVAHQAPLSVGFSRQYKSGMPVPSPGHLPDLRVKPVFLGSPALAEFFTTSTTWKKWDLFGTCRNFNPQWNCPAGS